MTMDQIGIEQVKLEQVRLGAERIPRIGNLRHGEASDPFPVEGIYNAILLENGGILMGENQQYIQLEESIESKLKSYYNF